MRALLWLALLCAVIASGCGADDEAIRQDAAALDAAVVVDAALVLDADDHAIDPDRSTAIPNPATGLSADGVQKSTITVHVRDRLDRPVAGAVVTIVVTGTGNNLVGPEFPTDTSGTTTATLTSTVAELKTLTVSANGVVFTRMPYANFIP
ncbi:MAG: Ig-like domain-containing protein [Deltaproteobacteria bacterium]|nr:Ig-like domain-containing protein [Deltaproteobacteria bacterium]